jgi:biotin carboxylase
MKNSQPTTAIFLIGSGIYMLDFYNFYYLKKIKNYRLVAIVNKDIVSAFPRRQKTIFDKIYVVTKNNIPSLCHLNFDEIESVIREELSCVDSSDSLRIFPFNEYNVLPAAYIREKFNIPGACSDLVNPFRDKFLMKNILKNNGIRVPRFVCLDLRRLSSHHDVVFNEITMNLGVPFIVKPVDGAGGLGVRMISNLGDFEGFKNELLSSVAGYEAEEFLDGELFHCDILFKDQLPILSLCAKYNYPLLDFKHGKNVGSIPLLDEHPLKQKIIDFTLKALQKLQLPDGITHTEVFYLPTVDELVLLESAARAPGALIVPMYEKTFGINILDFDFIIQMNQQQSNNKNSNSFCFWAVFPPIPGKVKGTIVPKLESKYKLEWFVKKGDNISPGESMRDRVGRIVVWNENYHALQRDFEYISNYNFIEVE